MSTLRRIELTRPGYDCSEGHDATLAPSTTCKPGTGGSHGRHNDEWIYVVVDDAIGFAVSLIVFSNELRGAPAALSDGYPRAGGLGFHARTTRTSGEYVNKCEFVGGQCRGDTAYLAADRLFRAHWQGPVRAQSDRFWTALEEVHAESVTRSMADAAERDAEDAEAERVARLNAAAPDLLAALEAMLAGPTEAKTIHDLRYDARAALAKAVAL